MKKRIMMLAMAAVFCWANLAQAENPEVLLKVDVFSKYICSNGAIASDKMSIQPNLQLSWKNGWYVGILSFLGVHNYNRNSASENDLYFGYTFETENLKFDTSYWYYMLYDLHKSSDDVNAIIEQVSWKTCPVPSLTPYVKLEGDMPNKKSGPKKGFQWRVGLQYEVATKYFPLKFDASLNAAENHVYGLKSGVTCGRLDVSAPIKLFSKYTLEPNIHYARNNGDPDGRAGKGFTKSNELWFGIGLSRTF